MRVNPIYETNKRLVCLTRGLFLANGILDRTDVHYIAKEYKYLTGMTLIRLQTNINT